MRIAVADREVGTQHPLGMIDTLPPTRDGYDTRARDLGELDRHPAHGAGGGADGHAAAGLDPPCVVDPHVRSHAGRAQHSDPLQRPAERQISDLGRRSGCDRPRLSV
jgi:hypothetical protein